MRIILMGLLGITLSGCILTRSEVTKSTPQPAPEPPVPVATLPPVRLDSDLMYKFLVAELAGHRGRLATSVELYLEAARETQDPRVAERATRIAVYSRDDESALEAARMWVEFTPDNLDARQMLAVMLIREGDTVAVMEQIDYILSSPHLDSEKGYFIIANLLSREQNKAKALKVMKSVVGNYPDNPHAYYAYSHLAELAGNLVIAAKAIRRTLELKPNWPTAVIQYARILQLSRETPRAIEFVQGVLQEIPEDMHLRLTYARLLVEAGHVEEAREQFELLAAHSPGNADILYTLGMLALQSEDLDTAEHYLKGLVKLEVREMEGRYFLGQIAELRKDYPAAVRWYLAINQGEQYLDAQIRIGLLYAQQGELDNARKHFQSISVRNSRQRIRIYLAEGDMLREAEQYQEALALYNVALEHFPEDTELMYARSLIAEKLDLLDITERDLRTILKFEPNNAHALNALGYTLADRTERYEEALAYIRLAYEIKPLDPAIIDSMGWINYRLGRHEEAVRYLRRALELNDDGEIAAHLGEVLWVMGDVQGARAIWSRALKSSPDHKLLLEVMRRFEQ